MIGRQNVTQNVDGKSRVQVQCAEMENLEYKQALDTEENERVQ